jgi:hypothetical protein
MSPKQLSAPGADPGSPELARLAGEVLDLLGGRSVRSRRLMGGVMAGALLGAALAGFLLRPRPSSGRRRHD